MQADGLVNLRDFVYLDVERVKSLLAQLDRGLLSQRSDSSEASTSVEGKGVIKIPALAEVGGGGQYVSTNQSTETRTLHDFVYNQTEEKLLELGRIKRLPRDFTGARLLSEDVRAALSPVEYVLVRGQLSFSDYSYMTSLLEHFIEIIKITVGFSYRDRLKAATGKEKAAIRQEIDRAVAAVGIDESYLKDLRRLFDVFLKDRLLIKVIPFPGDPNIRIVGPLQPMLLRERLEDIRYKFGSSPAADWAIFGQIAAVPQENETRGVLDLSFSNQLDQALQAMFDSIRGIEDQFRVTYPEIAITPIAIYRD